jgi:hypothetical protein
MLLYIILNRIVHEIIQSGKVFPSFPQSVFTCNINNLIK